MSAILKRKKTTKKANTSTRIENDSNASGAAVKKAHSLKDHDKAFVYFKYLVSKAHALLRVYGIKTKQTSIDSTAVHGIDTLSAWDDNFSTMFDSQLEIVLRNKSFISTLSTCSLLNESRLMEAETRKVFVWLGTTETPIQRWNDIFNETKLCMSHNVRDFTKVLLNIHQTRLDTASSDGAYEDHDEDEEDEKYVDDESDATDSAMQQRDINSNASFNKHALTSKYQLFDNKRDCDDVTSIYTDGSKTCEPPVVDASDVFDIDTGADPFTHLMCGLTWSMMHLYALKVLVKGDSESNHNHKRLQTIHRSKIEAITQDCIHGIGIWLNQIYYVDYETCRESSVIMRKIRQHVADTFRRRIPHYTTLVPHHMYPHLSERILSLAEDMNWIKYIPGMTLQHVFMNAMPDVAPPLLSVSVVSSVVPVIESKGITLANVSDKSVSLIKDVESINMIHGSIVKKIEQSVMPEIITPNSKQVVRLAKAVSDEKQKQSAEKDSDKLTVKVVHSSGKHYVFPKIANDDAANQTEDDESDSQ